MSASARLFGDYARGVLRTRTHKSSSASGSLDVRLARKATELLRRREMTRWAMCGRLRVGKGFLHVLQHRSEQPCVRPVSAVHVTAGHNAFRGSGPGQKLAFDNAVAHVGCPDRRIDRLCITCCSPSQPSHRAGYPARSRSRRECDGLLVMLALGHHGPGYPRDLVGKRDGRDLRGSPRQQRREPRPMFSAMDFGITDHS